MKQSKEAILAFRITDHWKKRAELIAQLLGSSLSQLAHPALCEKVVVEEEKLCHWETTGKLRQKITKLRGDKEEKYDWGIIRERLIRRIEEAEVLKEIVSKRDAEAEEERKTYWAQKETEPQKKKGAD